MNFFHPFLFLFFFLAKCQSDGVKNDKNEMVGQTTQNEKKKRKREEEGHTKLCIIFLTLLCQCVFIYLLLLLLSFESDDGRYDSNKNLEEEEEERSEEQQRLFFVFSVLFFRERDAGSRSAFVLLREKGERIRLRSESTNSRREGKSRASSSNRETRE